MSRVGKPRGYVDPMSGDVIVGEMPTGTVEAPTQDPIVVVCCTDVGDVAAKAVAAMRIPIQIPTQNHSGTPRVDTVAGSRICAAPADLRQLTGRVADHRVVVACRDGFRQRDAIVHALRRAGVPPSRIVIPDLSAARTDTVQGHGAEAGIRIRAAVVRAASIDTSIPIDERTARGPAKRVSRRSLFRIDLGAPKPVAQWNPGLRDSRTCAACVASCPVGALSLRGGAVHVDAEACTGCGACLSRCPATTLGSLSRASFEAEAQVLVDESRRAGSRFGVAITCSGAAPVALGQGWLPLAVPSLEAVTVGWPLQVAATGLAVALVDCGEPSCAERRRDLSQLFAQLRAAVGSAPSRPARPEGTDRRRDAGAGDSVAGDAVAGGAAAGDATSEGTVAKPLGPGGLSFAEPGATLGALRAMRSHADAGNDAAAAGFGRPDAAPWRVESALAPTGAVAIDASRCAACGLCVRDCPTDALADEHEPGRLTLSFDGSLCSACGACASICPNGAISVRCQVDSSLLDPRRQVMARVPTGALCRTCGGPLGAGLAIDVVAGRLAASHPAIADRLQRADQCADCLLSA
jgi:ferredoxin